MVWNKTYGDKFFEGLITTLWLLGAFKCTLVKSLSVHGPAESRMSVAGKELVVPF